MATVISDDAPATHAARPGIPYRFYVLGVLVVVGALSWIDRQLLAMVMQSIKTEFALSDSQLGLLGGTAFGLFYVTVGLPIAWLADRFNRRNIIAVALCFWSGMTALCGAATGYWSLFLARVGVGIGEAGQSAPSQSMVSDYFSERHRGIAMGILYSYLPIGYLVSYSAGGFFNDTIGWRNAFVIFGALGIVAAVVLRLTVREPVRGLMNTRSSAGSSQEPAQTITGSLRALLSRASVRHIPLAGAAHGIGMFGAALWLPSYFMRSYHMSSTDVGIRLALVMGVGGMIGTLGGGYLADRLVAKTGDARWNTWVSALAVTGTVPFTVAMYLSSDPRVAMMLFIVPAILNHAFVAPVVASMQNLGGLRRRALAAALYLFLANLISTGLGPLLVGVISDRLSTTFGADSLRYALLTLISVTSTWAGLHMLLASRTIRQDMASADAS